MPGRIAKAVPSAPVRPLVAGIPVGHVLPRKVRPTPYPAGARGVPPPAAATAPRPPPPAASRPRRRGVLGWVGAHKALTVAAALLLVAASVGIAVVVITQPIVATPTAGSSPVCFAAGDDISNLVGLGLAATPSISTGCGSATITIYGIPGASALQLGEVLELVNADTSDNVAFTVALSVSGTPAASLTGFTLSFVDDVSGTPTTRNWNLLTTPTLTTYTLSDGETWELNVNSLVMTALASGSQGALTITASITQV